jgi:GH43 family beta-xylosidase
MKTFSDSRPLYGQDPHVVKYEGKYLLVQSAYGDSRIVIKSFEHLEEMNRNQSQTVWMGKERQVWAPELHQILGKWYIYYAASDGNNSHHRMYALAADCPFGPYHSLGKLITPKEEDFWAIDQTIFEHESKVYTFWSGWDENSPGFPQHLYGAVLEEPNRIGIRFKISSPDFNWEGKILEGPQIVQNKERIFLTYSANCSWKTEYCVGILEYQEGSLLDPDSWIKHAKPILRGGGHGCFLEGNYIYHKKLSPFEGWTDRVITHLPYYLDDCPRIGGVPCRPQE